MGGWCGVPTSCSSVAHAHVATIPDKSIINNNIKNNVNINGNHLGGRI
jgi:hypothetical protein